MCTITLNRYKSGTIHTLSRCVDLLKRRLMCSNTLNEAHLNNQSARSDAQASVRVLV